MFAEQFDDFRRKMLAVPVSEYPFEVKRLQTCMKGTPLFDTWMDRFLDPDDSDIHLTIEPDGNTYTFYTIIPRKLVPDDVAPGGAP